MKKLIVGRVLCGVVVLLTSSTAVAAVNLGACKGCHGASFEKKAMGKSKVVSNMSKQEVSDAMIGYKNGTYGGPMKALMKAQVAKYSDEELKSTRLGK